MFEPLLILIAAAFLLAGFVKGVIGLGLPTVSMGLLAVTMPPSHALAIVIVPAIITNIWQTFVGPYPRDIIRRLWLRTDESILVPLLLRDENVQCACSARSQQRTIRVLTPSPADTAS